jgi:protein-S-isoprenylcysteine O-methyltransferase Ste14
LLFPYRVIAGTVLFIDLVFIRVEEKMLANQFGVQWEAYRKHTGRWV